LDFFLFTTMDHITNFSDDDEEETNTQYPPLSSFSYQPNKTKEKPPTPSSKVDHKHSQLLGTKRQQALEKTAKTSSSSSSGWMTRTTTGEARKAEKGAPPKRKRVRRSADHNDDDDDDDGSDLNVLSLETTLKMMKTLSESLVIEASALLFLKNHLK
jgi:hypothetical protein